MVLNLGAPTGKYNMYDKSVCAAGGADALGLAVQCI